VFLELLRRTPTVEKIADLVQISPLLAFADSPVCTIELRAGFKVIATALAEQGAITIVYERASHNDPDHENYAVLGAVGQQCSIRGYPLSSGRI
jgi:hypothetical protein